MSYEPLLLHIFADSNILLPCALSVVNSLQTHLVMHEKEQQQSFVTFYDTDHLGAVQIRV